MTRKLASVQRIKNLVAIPGADRIEVAIINGWQVVVKKGDFKVGDLIVYLEIDPWVPTAVAPFLTEEGKEPKEFEGVKGERLKTIKLRKTLSQGLVLPMAAAQPYLHAKVAEFEEGDDITAALGILKWEMPEKAVPGRNPGSSQGKRFPSFIPKTDQERVQNYGALVERELDTEFEVTMKKDGSSITVFRVNPESPYYKDAKAMYEERKTIWQRIKAIFVKEPVEPVYGICSRNVLLPLNGDSNFHTAAKKLSEALAYDEGSVAIQAELVAPDIQNNYEKVSEVEVHIFDVFDIDSQEYKLPDERNSYLNVAFAPWAVPHTNVLAKGKLRDILGYKDGDDIVKLALAYASGPGDNKGVAREGVVFKAMNKDFSFKAVSNEYLMLKG